MLHILLKAHQYDSHIRSKVDMTSHPAASAEVEILRGHNNIGIASSAYATHFSHSLTHFCPLGHDLLLSLCPLKGINKLEIPSYQMSRLSILIVCRKIYRNTIICQIDREEVFLRHNKKLSGHKEILPAI